MHGEDVVVCGVEGDFGGVGGEDAEEVGGALCGCVGGERHGEPRGDRSVFWWGARCKEGERVEQPHPKVADEVVPCEEGRCFGESKHGSAELRDELDGDEGLLGRTVGFDVEDYPI